MTEACPDSFAKYVVNCIDANFKDGTAVIELRGGTYTYDFSANPEGEDTSYVAEGYGVVQTTEGDRTVYEVLSVAENPDAVFAASSADALVALLNGGAQNVMLSEDVSLATMGFSGAAADVTVDLNNKTLTLNSGDKSNGILNGAHLTFKNGTLNATIGDGSPTANANFISLTLEKVDYTANGTAIYVQGDGTDDAATASKIVIKESVINSGAYAVGTNASVKDGDNAYKNVNIEVTKSELYATLGSGILFNVAGTLTVSESTIYGAEQGIFLRAGTAVISDSTLGTSYDGTDEYLTQDWKSGTSGVRAALTLGNRNGTYYADAVCTLKGEIKFDLAEEGTIPPPIYVYANKNADEDINDGKPFTTTLDYTAATGVGFKDIVVGKDSADVDIVVLTISDAEGLMAFAQAVNGGDTFEGKTVRLTQNIDLAGKTWTPIGNATDYPSITFAGTFDGCGYTISNMTVHDETQELAASGFFGSITGTVRNLKFVKANVTSTHYAGVVVGYSSANGCRIENCTVSDSKVTTVPELTEKGYNNGDKAGGIVGYCVTGDVVTGCTVENTTIKGYRDIGGICGCAGSKDVLTGNTVGENVKLVQDNTNGYEKGEITTVGAIAGRIVGENNAPYDSTDGKNTGMVTTERIPAQP